MKQYTIKYDRTITTILFILLPPLIIIGGIACVFVTVRDLPEWAVVTLITTCMAGIFIFTFLNVKKISPGGTLTLSDHGFVVEFSEPGRFHTGSFEVNMEQVRTFKMNAKSAGFYMSFTTDSKPWNFNLSPGAYTEAEFIDFVELIGEITRMWEQENARRMSPGNKTKY